MRRTPPRRFHFDDGDIYDVRAPRLALLGTDCSLHKADDRLRSGTATTPASSAEMVYTGQTGWMQGGDYGVSSSTTTRRGPLRFRVL